MCFNVFFMYYMKKLLNASWLFEQGFEILLTVVVNETYLGIGNVRDIFYSKKKLNFG